MHGNQRPELVDTTWADIVGGRFKGPQLRGLVLPGGADRQLQRIDGVKEPHARYGMQTHDGSILAIRNRVTIDESASPHRYARSTVQIHAPQGRYAWLNRRIFIGTLHSLRPEREAVQIGVYAVV